MKIIIGYKEIKASCINMCREIEESEKKYTGVYGIPKGGVPIAIFISSILKIPVLDTPEGNNILVVDDIVDSGKTISRYSKHDTAALYYKPHSNFKPTFKSANTLDWIEFPWEKNELPAEDAVTRILQMLGENPNREGLIDTPKRVVKSWLELYGGYRVDPKDILNVTFSEGKITKEIVVCKEIDFYSMCEHHMLPFYGKAHVGYIPNDKVVGLSKLARLVDVYARRLQIQENMTNQIADALIEYVNPLGVMVVIEGTHFCMTSRGVKKQNAKMNTSAIRGVFKEDHGLKNDFYELIK